MLFRSIDKKIIQTINYSVNAPVIQYQQGNHNRCAFCSLASALHIINFKNTAENLMEYMKFFYEKYYEENFERIMQNIQYKII